MAMPALHSIILVDDHAVMRQALASLIEALGPYRVTAQYSNGQDLLDAVPFAQSPALILLDLMMPVMNGREVMRHLQARGLQYPVLVLSNEVDAGNVIELIRLGARGYLPKACTAIELRRALEAVLQNGYYHSELERSAFAGDTLTEGPDAQPLSPREVEFVRLACSPEEYTYRHIAGLMGISERTVDTHRETVFRKLGLKSKTGMFFYALKHGLIASAS